MAYIEETRTRSNKRHRHSLRVDLTPMVDLGFLLITFFILTTSMTRPTVTHLIMPKDDVVKTPVQKSAVLKIILLKNHQVSYSEMDEKVIIPSSYAGIRLVIQGKQKRVAAALGDRSKTILIINPSKESTYKDFMEIIDEIEINDVKHYYVVD